MTEATGWVSQFDIAARTQRRIVLHGNILDWVQWDGEALTLPDWIRRRAVERHGVRRVVRYNHGEEPRVLHWEDLTAPQGQERLATLMPGQRRDPADPVSALRLLRALVREPTARAAVILENTEHRFDEPSLEAVLYRQLARDGADGTVPHGLVIHLYTTESRIPHDFVVGDPETRVILVSAPTFSERRAFLERLPAETKLLRARERGAALSTARLAGITEGYSLRELDQLVGLADQEEVGIDIFTLLALGRHGRRINYWANQDISETRAALHRVVRGQSDAIEKVIEAVYLAKGRVMGLVDDAARLPAMLVFFVGATGVGKTLMARAISQAITGTEENLKRIDMTEYQQEHADQKLIGSPPGYVGHDDGGQLTNWVRARPYSVVLLDEVEKAHQRILDVFMQMAEGARLTDGKGRTVDLSETIIIFTSNIGTAEAMRGALDRGDRRAVEEHFEREVERFFNENLHRPELYGRLKLGMVVFSYIGADVARAAFEAKLQALADGVARRFGNAVRLHFDPTSAGDREVIDQLLRRANYEEYGLRDVNTTVLKLAGPAVGKLLDEESPPAATWRFYWNNTDRRVQLVPCAGAQP